MVCFCDSSQAVEKTRCITLLAKLSGGEMAFQMESTTFHGASSDVAVNTVP